MTARIRSPCSTTVSPARATSSAGSGLPARVGAVARRELGNELGRPRVDRADRDSRPAAVTSSPSPRLAMVTASRRRSASICRARPVSSSPIALKAAASARSSRGPAGVDPPRPLSAGQRAGALRRARPAGRASSAPARRSAAARRSGPTPPATPTTARRVASVVLSGGLGLALAGLLARLGLHRRARGADGQRRRGGGRQAPMSGQARARGPRSLTWAAISCAEGRSARARAPRHSPGREIAAAACARAGLPGRRARRATRLLDPGRGQVGDRRGHLRARDQACARSPAGRCRARPRRRRRPRRESPSARSAPGAANRRSSVA